MHVRSNVVRAILSGTETYRRPAAAATPARPAEPAPRPAQTDPQVIRLLEIALKPKDQPQVPDMSGVKALAEAAQAGLQRALASADQLAQVQIALTKAEARAEAAEARCADLERRLAAATKSAPAPTPSEPIKLAGLRFRVVRDTMRQMEEIVIREQS